MAHPPADQPTLFEVTDDAPRRRSTHRQGWPPGHPEGCEAALTGPSSLRRRGRAPDRTNALARDQIEALLGREDVGLRGRTLWRLL
jgi:hypothetical protein